MLIHNIHCFKNVMSSLSFTYLVFSHLDPDKDKNGSQFKMTPECMLKL